LARNEPPLEEGDTPAHSQPMLTGSDGEFLEQSDQEPDLYVEEKPKRRQSPFGALKALVFGQPVSDDTRLRELSLAIIEYPRSPSNYVLRGELYLHYREYGRAEADFRRALLLAAEAVETENWGILAQAMQDRALAGWQKAVQHL
jgi:tetratricopeptide (TPR) repeat protein